MDWKIKIQICTYSCRLFEAAEEAGAAVEIIFRQNVHQRSASHVYCRQIVLQSVIYFKFHYHIMHYMKRRVLYRHT
jgi:hypothetical protein